jgi:hypothetical protein
MTETALLLLGEVLALRATCSCCNPGSDVTKNVGPPTCPGNVGTWRRKPARIDHTERRRRPDAR